MRNSKKGFTIVELVIVIAVIAILAAVLIPTFSSVTNSARASAAQQQAKAGLDSIIALTEGSLPDGTLFVITNDTDSGSVDYTFTYTGNKLAQVETDKAVVEKFAKTNDYAVYVTASAFTSSTNQTEIDNAAKKKATVEALLLNCVKDYINFADGTFSGAIKAVKINTTVTTNDYYAIDIVTEGATDAAADDITYSIYTTTNAYNATSEPNGYTDTKKNLNVTFRVYYTSDIQETQVVFVGQD